MGDVNRVVVYGAGNIGRGIVSHLFSQAGYRLLFYSRGTEKLKAIQESGGYSVYSQENGKNISQKIEGFDILSNEAALIQALAEVDLAACCLYPAAFRDVARVLAASARERRIRNNKKPLIVMLCCNELGGAAKLQDDFQEEWKKQGGSGSERTVRILPTIVNSVGFHTEIQSKFDVMISSNGYLEVELSDEDAQIFPAVEGIRRIPDAEGYLCRKLYLGNMFHTYAALLGKERGYHWMKQCYADVEIKRKVKRAFAESEAALLKAYKYPAAEYQNWREMMLAKMDVPSEDDVERVLADLPRKLRRSDRLLGPLRLCIGKGCEYKELLQAVTLGLNCLAGETHSKKGRDWLISVCGLEPENPIDQTIWLLTAEEALYGKCIESSNI